MESKADRRWTEGEMERGDASRPIGWLVKHVVFARFKLIADVKWGFTIVCRARFKIGERVCNNQV